MNWFYVLLFVQLFLPSTSVLFKKTYGDLECISPGFLTSLSSARSWCKHHGSTLAEISSEHIWNLTLVFVEENGLYSKGDLILNAHGKELPAWTWISGEDFTDIASYPLSYDTRMYARLSRRRGGIISVEESFPDCLSDRKCRNGYVCEHEEVSRCDVQTYNTIVLDGTCYVIHHDESVNWFEAYNECERTNGRLATFENMKKNESQIAKYLNFLLKYWIGLNRYEWRWIDSGQLLTYTHFETCPLRNHSCISVNFPSRRWHSMIECTQDIFGFICIRDTTKCASNPCRDGETCVGSINNHSCECFAEGQCQTISNKCDSNLCLNGGSCYDNVNNHTCRCAPGFIGTQCQTDANECSSNPCHNGGTCTDSVNSYMCQCAPGFTGTHCESNNERTSDPCRNGAICTGNVNNHTCTCTLEVTGSRCHTCSSNEIVPPATYMMIVIVLAVVVIIISTIVLVVVCIRRRNKTKKSEDAELASRYETWNTFALDNHIYSDMTGPDKRDITEADGKHTAGQESWIYEHVVY